MWGWIVSLVSALVAGGTIKAVALRLFAALGIGVVSYVGYQALFVTLQQRVAALYGGLAEDMAAVMHIAGVDSAISIILSGYSIRLGLLGLTQAGALKRVLWRPNQQGTLF